jgi:DNA-binding transcriptional LysR family regulator
VRLLTRSTRSVSPTHAGEQLIAHLRPALDGIRSTLTDLSELQSRPAGRVRLLCCHLAVKNVLVPRLGEFVQRYPNVELDITTAARGPCVRRLRCGDSVRRVHR